MTSTTWSPSDTWAPEPRPPLWARLLGCRQNFFEPGNSFRTCWGEFSPSGWGIGIEIGAYQSAHLNIMHLKGQSFIRLPFLDKWFADRDECSLDNPRFGFSLPFGGSEDHTALRVAWGRKSKSFDMPWQWRYWKREFLAVDGEWYPSETHRWVDGKLIDIKPPAEAWSTVLPYHYMLDNGTVQSVNATVKRERCRREWVWFSEKGRLSTFLRRFSPTRVDHTIDIRFDAEVGSRAGSWKGGALGCGWTMQGGESVESALRRMQKERRFR